MKRQDFYFDLPEELIAQDPLSDRASSRLMILDKQTGEITHRIFHDITEYLKPGDCLVLNDTKVIPARLIGEREETGGKVEVLLLKRGEDNVWETLVKPGKKARPGTRLVFGGGLLRAEVVDIVEEGNRLIRFEYEGIFEEILDQLGQMPLPPYITHKLEDKNRYQTVYAKYEGSAAAPTAGLHFTTELLQQIEQMGVSIARVTLHVGLGTFRPVKVDDVEQHHMHTEFYRVTKEAADQIVAAQIENGKNKVPAPGSVPIHYDETGFFREVYENDYGVIEGIKKYISYLPAYNLEFFRVDDPQRPCLPAEDLYSIIPMNGKRPYDIYDVIGRLFDGSQLYEYKKGYGPEMVTGLAKVNGLLVGVIANTQGLLMNYPEYKQNSVGIGGKLYRQGLIKMNEFVTLCARDRIPLIWLQDTTGIDVGDEAEKAELLGLGQSLIYSIENSKLPSLEITLRKASAAAHYVLGGPQGNNTNVYSLGTAACEYYVMPGETAANAMYSRKLVKASKAGEDLAPIIKKMNDMIQLYHEKSRPEYCAKVGMVDEIVDMTELRPYIQAFTEAVYQNPKSICPMHQMVTPRAIREWNDAHKA